MKQIIFDPDLDQRQKDGYYFVKAYCTNCDSPGITGDIDVMIPKGESKPTEKYKCPNCECRTLKIY